MWGISLCEFKASRWGKVNDKRRENEGVYNSSLTTQSCSLSGMQFRKLRYVYRG